MDVVSSATSADVAGRPVAVLPIGSFEQHGKYLPLSTDTLIACMIAEGIASAYGLFLLPPVTVSCSHEHSAWPGTVSISSSTLTLIISDIRASLIRSGIDKLVVVNGHGGNYVLSNVVQEANVAGALLTLFPGRLDWESARSLAGLSSNAHDDMHAGEIETSMLLHTFPDVVRPGYERADEGGGPRPHLLIHGMKAYTGTGVIGSPSLATADKGKRVLESLVESFEDHLTALGVPTARSGS